MAAACDTLAVARGAWGNDGAPGARHASHAASPRSEEFGADLAGLMADHLSSSEGEDSSSLDEYGAETTSLSIVGDSLTAIPPNLAATHPQLRRLCLHGNAIASLSGLAGLAALQDLNLSSNSLSEIPGGVLAGLGQLTALNLASNCLTELPSSALAGLTRLRRLSLAHNSLTSLAGLAVLQGGPLRRLDVRDNALASLADFSVLAGFPCLAELLVSGGVPGNPVCLQQQYRPAIAAALPNLQQLDGQAVSPAEAMQYLAAVRLQAFQPATVAAPAPAALQTSSGQQQQQQQQQQQAHQQQQGCTKSATTAVQAVRNPQAVGSQDAAAPARQVQASSIPTNTPDPLQRIQQVLASFAGRPAPDGLVQPMEAKQQSAVNPEAELFELLQSCPQLAGVMSKALQQVQPTNNQPSTLAAEQPCHAPSGAIPQQEAVNQRPVQQTSAATQTEADNTAWEAAAAAAARQEEVQQQVAALQDEVEALQAELEVQAQAAQRAQQDAAAAAQRHQKQAADAAQQADARLADTKRAAAVELQQAQGEVAGMKARCEALESQLREATSRAAAGQQRQEDLEYELARAWQELDGSEAARQAEQQRAAAEMERQAAELERGQFELAAAKCELAATQQEAAKRQQLADRLQAQGASAEQSSLQQREQLQRELAAAQAQLAAQEKQLQDVSAREHEAAQQLRQLSSTLAAVHEEHDAALAALQQQHTQELQAVVAASQTATAVAQAERDEVQRRLAETEGEFRCALQEAARESQEVGRDLEALAAECVELRRALQDSQARRQEAEGLASELSSVVQQQKLRMRGLAQERAEACARLQAMNPQELERLRGELLALRERAGELSAIRDQLTQERRLTESLQQRLAGAQQQLLEARQEGAGRLAEAEAQLKTTKDEAARRVAAAEGVAAEARGRVEQLAEEAEKLRDAVKVKEAMVDSANERISDLKRALAEARAAADEARVMAEEAEEELRAMQAGDGDKAGGLRSEIEAQEEVIDQLERRLADAERRAQEAGRRAVAAEAAAEEKAGMIVYVGEEVERVKELFKQKEARLVADHSGAQQAAAELRAERDSLLAATQQLEGEGRRLGQHLAQEQARARTAADAAAQYRAQAVEAAARVAEVEEELREVLLAMEQQKAASAAKFAQLQSVLQDAPTAFLHL